MNIKMIAIAMCASPAVSLAASIQIQDVNIDIEGGVTASAMYFDNPGFLRRHDSYILNDALIEIMPENKNDKSFRFYGAVGVLQQQGIDRIFAPLPPVDIKLQYGWLEIPTRMGRYIQIGQLITKLGHESVVSYKNSHSLTGAVKSGQPNLYPGFRFGGPLAAANYYTEVTNDSTIGDASAAVGLYKQTDKYRFSVSYFEAIDERRMIDLVYTKQSRNLLLGINLDMHAIIDPAPNQDENALGLVFYIQYNTGQWRLPARLEYINDGNTGIYDYDSGYTLTLSPAYYYTKTRFFRAEIVAAKSDGSPFRNADGGFEGDQFIATLQAGLTF